MISQATAKLVRIKFGSRAGLAQFKNGCIEKRQTTYKHLSITNKLNIIRRQQHQYLNPSKPTRQFAEKYSEQQDQHKNLFLISSTILLHNFFNVFSSHAQDESGGTNQLILDETSQQQIQQQIIEQQQTVEGGGATDGIISVMFGFSILLLTVVTLGVVYLLVTQFFDKRQENKDKEDLEKKEKEAAEKQEEKKGKKKKLVNPTGKGFGGSK
eukprot:TRINITY_DN9212_c0_g1_i3.p1 TRINITY_DN9212_c0_g1~~TRINITY_DN9212_c0_g1_i3.p1  ORF type:complete len:212 (+),score=22.82 TRINITY_DN9212_c0_g1_i3:188-823(+)